MMKLPGKLKFVNLPTKTQLISICLTLANVLKDTCYHHLPPSFSSINQGEQKKHQERKTHKDLENNINFSQTSCSLKYAS